MKRIRGTSPSTEERGIVREEGFEFIFTAAFGQYKSSPDA